MHQYNTAISLQESVLLSCLEQCVIESKRHKKFYQNQFLQLLDIQYNETHIIFKKDEHKSADYVNMWEAVKQAALTLKRIFTNRDKELSLLE